jgi:hypothetical protein
MVAAMKVVSDRYQGSTTAPNERVKYRHVESGCSQLLVVERCDPLGFLNCF